MSYFKLIYNFEEKIFIEQEEKKLLSVSGSGATHQSELITLIGQLTHHLSIKQTTMDELTENLQKLNMIRMGFDQNKDMNKYQPGSLSKKQGPSKCRRCKVAREVSKTLIYSIFKHSSGSTEAEEGESRASRLRPGIFKV